jgi:hypothetical protein
LRGTGCRSCWAGCLRARGWGIGYRVSGIGYRVSGIGCGDQGTKGPGDQMGQGTKLPLRVQMRRKILFLYMVKRMSQ